MSVCLCVILVYCGDIFELFAIFTSPDNLGTWTALMYVTARNLKGIQGSCELKGRGLSYRRLTFM